MDRWNFESLHMLFVICTCDTTLHSCYKRIMHLFSANQKLVIFSFTLYCNNLVQVLKMTSWSHLNHLYIEEIKSNPQVYTTQEGIREIKNNPQVYTTQEGIREIKNNPQVYTTWEGKGEIKSNP